MITTGDLDKAWDMGVNGAIFGGIAGGSLGAFRGFRSAKALGNNPWTGKEKAMQGSFPSNANVNIPDGYTAKPSKKGNGTLYFDPNNPHNNMRVMPGNPNSPNPAQQNPYVTYKVNGVAYDLNGLSLPSANVPAAHIPLNLSSI